MAKPTVMVRLYTDIKEEVDKEASQDRRTLQDTLEILLREAIDNRRAITSQERVG